jgi:hypothetical protein
MPLFSATSPATSPAWVPALPVACTTWSIRRPMSDAWVTSSCAAFT